MPLPSSGGSGGSGTTLTSGAISKTAHGFLVGNIVGYNGTTYVKAQANNSVNAEATGIVTSVIDVNTFTFSQSGLITGLSGLIPGEIYFLSDSVAGTLTATEPTAVSSVSKPLLEAVSATSGYYTNMRGTPALGQTAIVQYGETVITPLTSTTGSTIFVDVPGSSFTLPTAGTWNVFYYLPVFTSGTNRAEAQIYTSADVLVADTGSVINGTTGVGGANIPLLNTARIITTEATTYKLKWATSGGTLSMSSSSIGDLAPKITWTQIGASPVPMDLMGEYGTLNIPTITTGSTTYVDIPNSSFTLPTAGTWEVSYFLSVSNSSAGNGGTIRLTDNLGNIISGGQISEIPPGASGNRNSASQQVFITTSGSATYKLQWRVNAGIMELYNGTGAVEGNSKINWKKVSGFIPSSGQTVDYKSVSDWNVAGIVANTDVVFTNSGAGNIPYSAGLFTLSAGKTYEITGHLEGTITGNTGTDWLQFILCDSTNTQLPNSPKGIITGTANSSNWQNSSTVNTIFTPTVTTQVKLRLSNRGSSASFSTNTGLQSGVGCWMSVKQLGSSNAIAGLYLGTWGTYVPTITAVTTNPTKPSSGIVIDTASYIIEGKKLTVNYNFWIGTAVGANAGSGTYKFSLPSGIVIDTTKVTTIASVEPTLINPNIANILGTVELNRGSQTSLTSKTLGHVYAADANNFTAAAMISAYSTLSMFDSAAGNAALQSGIGWKMQFTVPIV